MEMTEASKQTTAEGSANPEPDQILSPRRSLELKQKKWWISVSLCIFLVLLGDSLVMLLLNFFYVQDNREDSDQDLQYRGTWLQALVQNAAFPLLIPLFFIFPSPKQNQETTNTRFLSFRLILLYISLGVLVAAHSKLFALGKLYANFGVFTLISATQLIFTAIFAAIINRFKFTRWIILSIIGSILIYVFGSPEFGGEPDENEEFYSIQAWLTFAASVAFALSLCLFQLCFEKVLVKTKRYGNKKVFRMVIEMQICVSFVATVVCLVGLFASGENKELQGDSHRFKKGETYYVLSLIGLALSWQVWAVGLMGLVLYVSVTLSLLVLLFISVNSGGLLFVMDEKSGHSPVASQPEESAGYGEKALPNYNGNDVQTEGLISEDFDGLKRELSGRQIQMVTIGGSIGTALFVSIGSGLTQGGPASLFIAFILYSCFLGLVNNCMAEMSVFMPVSGSFVRMGSKWVDEAFGFMLGWNFFLYEAILIPWEISALNLVLTFWSDNIPLAAICAGCIFLYGVINIFAVKWYGESEFWLSGGKVVLIAMIFSFTFITMVGGNPKHDAYGFRYWKEPGAFAEYVTTGSLGRFEGFLAALWKAAFTIVGPEYIAMMSGEAAHPRKNLKRAFKTIYWRFGVFFIGGALACGIVIPYNDKKLIAYLSAGGSETGTAASSPYVIAMQNLGIGVLPHITNALLVTSIFSAGNSYVYCACRTLYSLSLDGHAPRFLRKCTKSGVPIYCFCVTMIFPFLSFLAVGSSSSQVITWLANLTEASQIIDYICMCTIYIFFFRALKTQGIDRSTLPYVGWYQPYCAWAGLVAMILTVGCYGYTTFLPGWWDTGTFFSYYTMVFVCPLLYGGWKIIKKTKVVKPEEADLVWERPIIDAYEASVAEKHISFWEEVKIMMGFGKKEMHVE